ncbi:MAG: 6-hydroxymethylpterin diphosphokinase MptE-like protein [Phycisphaerae bacterium]
MSRGRHGAGKGIRPGTRVTMDSVQTLNDVFLANMRRLWRHDAWLAQRIDELPEDAALDVEPSKKGPATASVRTDDGRKLYLHSRYDPLREAADFCKGLEVEDAACVILCGLGLGYHLKALFDRYGEGAVVFVTEPDLVAIKTALETTDLSTELATRHVEFITTLDKARLHERLNPHGASLMLGTAIAVPPAARDHRADFHAQCREAILDFAAFAKMSLTTLVRNAEITCRNIANNLPAYVSTPPPDVFRRRFAGRPAILVAAGPSLAKNIDRLAELQDKAVILAAQTTLGPLLERGIRPHFVTSLDFSDLSRQFFEGRALPEDLVLVAEPKASWHVIDAFIGTDRKRPRRVVLLDNVFARRCIGDSLAPRSAIEAGATVMHLAFYFARWLDCDPIIFIGQDLAFTGHCYYAPGVAMHRAWSPELGRFSTLEMKEWERIARQRKILRRVRDQQGRPIYTDEQLFTYLEQFERDFAGCSARVIDATEGGARKAGTEAMPLREAAERFCRRPIDAACFDYLQTEWWSPSKLRPARDALVERREELGAFRDLCRETAALLEEMQSLVDRPEAFNRRVVRVDELRTLVQNHEVLFQMVRDVSQRAEFQKLAADHSLAASDARGGAKAVRQLKRDRRFVDALLDGCDRLDRILDAAIERFDQALVETAEAETRPDRPPETGD